MKVKLAFFINYLLIYAPKHAAVKSLFDMKVFLCDF